MTHRSTCLLAASILSALSVPPTLLHLWMDLHWGPAAMTAMSFASATTVAVPLALLRDALRSPSHPRSRPRGGSPSSSPEVRRSDREGQALVSRLR